MDQIFAWDINPNYRPIYKEAVGKECHNTQPQKRNLIEVLYQQLSVMAPMNRISELKPFKSMWKIKVKIIRLWNQFSAAGGETIELVFVDAWVSFGIFDCFTYFWYGYFDLEEVYILIKFHFFQLLDRETKYMEPSRKMKLLNSEMC